MIGTTNQTTDDPNSKADTGDLVIGKTGKLTAKETHSTPLSQAQGRSGQAAGRKGDRVPRMILSRKKVLFLVPAFAAGVGGAERVITILLRHLDHSRFECHLALVGEGRAFLEDVPGEVAVHHLGVSRMRYCAPAVVGLIRQLRPDTILSTVIYLNAMLMLARPFLSGRPRILLREASLPS